MEAASYKGIAMKTLYFVAVFAAGMGAYFYIHNFFGGGAQAFSTEYTIFVGALIATAIAGLVASFAPKTTAVTGSIYSAGMGYALTFIREYSITDKFICNAVEFDSNNLPCT